MKKAIFPFLVLFTIGTGFSDELPASISFSAKGRFIKIHDPGFIVIELESGKRIDSTYGGIDYETLHRWEKEDEQEGKPREFVVTYNEVKGVFVHDLQTGTEFLLNGVIDPHPIDLAADKLEKEFGSTAGIVRCKELALNAWDAELNRAYQELGGSKDPKLKSAQVAWMKFRDSQTEYLRSEYGKRQGTIWRIVYMEHVVDITKRQAIRLQRIKEW